MFEYMYQGGYAFRFAFLTRLSYVKKWKRKIRVGHVRRREENINSNKILVETPGGKIHLKRSVRKLKVNIKLYLEERVSKAVNCFRMGFLRTCNGRSVFRRVRKIAKSNWWLRQVRLSA